MPRIIRAFALALVLSIVFSFTSFYGECNEIRGKVLRLHVLANSDSEEDQALKMLVRDTISAHSAGIFDASNNAGEAYEIAKAQLSEIEQVAQQKVYDEGYNYEVKAELTEMYFTTRQYEKITLPAGNYDALRLSIGEAQGKNWWCIVFPPICFSAATENTEVEEISEVLEPEEEAIVTESENYEVKFKVVEIFESVRNKFKEMFSK